MRRSFWGGFPKVCGRLLVLAGLLGFAPAARATTTSGATTRNVLIDGVVTLGGAPGANGANWETDEEFQGFTGAVNWYVTWDDNNLYLGRIGGNNLEGSVIYLRADYPGAIYAPRGQTYDFLQPDVTPMGGVNFAAYFKDSYHEYRTFNGVWSAQTANTLNPQYSTQTNGANMEVAIPWSAITAGNGLPSNLRLVLYQVVMPGPGCVSHFVYGESPWGTGNTGDGPSLGVNDGVPVSLRQPGGCDVGDSTAWRWWGCYPVIGGVGANGWSAVAPNAGPDDSICQTATSYFLQGNTPPGTAIGTWSVVAQPPGSGIVTFANPNANNPNALAQNLSSLGTYTLVWDINYGGCPSLPDTVVITRVPNSSVALAMPDTVLTCNGDTALLRANSPGNGSSLWTTAGAGIVIANPFDSVTVASNLLPGYNVFHYQISNGVCPTTSDSVLVYVPIGVTADAGPDQSRCFASTATLAASDPDLIQPSANGFWSQFQGPNNGIFTNLSFYASNFSALVPGTYTLVWSVTNHDCPIATDTMVIRNFDAVAADAGGDQNLCLGSPVSLAGNDVSALGDSAAGYWSLLAGPTTVTIANPDAAATAVTGLGAGSYFFSWLVSNGSCPPDSETVEIRMIEVQDNFVTDSIRPDSGQQNGNLIVATPSGGIPPYSYSIDGLNFGTDPLFGNLGAGTYTVLVMDATGCTDSFSIVLIAIPPMDTVAPPDTLQIPTGFSPNSDLVNDTWEIPGIEAYPNADVQVFNIWGGLVYQSIGVYQPWNGQRNGQDLPSANYYFIVDLKVQGMAPLQGSLMLLR